MKTVLFGAGAEVGYDLCSGKQFAKVVLGISDAETGKIVSEMKKAMKRFFKNRKYDYIPDYVVTCIQENQLLNASVMRKFQETEGEIRFTQKELKEKIKQKKREIIENNQQNELFENHLSYMGILDEKFHTIINPNFYGPHKFWTVINCYFRAWLYVVGGMIDSKNTTEEFYYSLLENPYEAICQCNSKKYDRRGYYGKLIGKDDLRIVTSNYTPICEMVTGICEESGHIAYLHGKINMFEFPHDLRITPIEENMDQSEFAFPFLLIQSGVKPIIGKYQLEEFSKFGKYLDESDELIILGYNINPDDNHINAYIKQFIKDGKTVVYLSYRDSVKEDSKKDKKEDILRRLRITEDSEASRLVFRKIYRRDAEKVFEEVIG